MIWRTNEEFYDNIMLITLGECYGEYHTAVRQYAELNKTSKEIRDIQIEQDIRQLPPYLERLRDFKLWNWQCPAEQTRWKRLRGKKFAEYGSSFTYFWTESWIEYSDCYLRTRFVTSTTVHRMLQEKKLHAFHYTRVHLKSDYWARRTLCPIIFLIIFPEKNQSRSHISFLWYSPMNRYSRKGIINSHNMHL